MQHKHDRHTASKISPKHIWMIRNNATLKLNACRLFAMQKEQVQYIMQIARHYLWGLKKHPHRNIYNAWQASVHYPQNWVLHLQQNNTPLAVIYWCSGGLFEQQLFSAASGCCYYPAGFCMTNGRLRRLLFSIPYDRASSSIIGWKPLVILTGRRRGAEHSLQMRACAHAIL